MSKFLSKLYAKNIIINVLVVVSISTCGITLYNKIKNKNSLEMEKNIVTAQFSHKVTIVSFILAVFVMYIHAKNMW